MTDVETIENPSGMPAAEADKLAARGDGAVSLDISNEAYHGERGHTSHSGLQMFRQSPPAYYETYVTGRMRSKETQPLRLGTGTHMAVCEPERFEQTALLIPKDVLGSNGSKSTNAWKAFAAENAGRLLLTQAELDGMRWQADNVHRHPVAGPLLKRSTACEQSIFWTDSKGRKLKCRIDAAQEIDAEIVDVKTSTHHRGEFWRAVRDYNLHCQAAFYCDGFASYYGDFPAFRFLVIRNEPPYEVYVVTLPERVLKAGTALNAKALDDLQACYEGRRKWLCEGYDVESELELPAWFCADGESYTETY
jgi:exodeoxyribonuclease VIII